MISRASSNCRFDILDNPDEITTEWNRYWDETEEEASIIGNNCAVAAQWFLTRFAGIPAPSLVKFRSVSGHASWSNHVER